MVKYDSSFQLSPSVYAMKVKNVCKDFSQDEAFFFFFFETTTIILVEIVYPYTPLIDKICSYMLRD